MVHSTNTQQQRELSQDEKDILKRLQVPPVVKDMLNTFWSRTPAPQLPSRAVKGVLFSICCIVMVSLLMGTYNTDLWLVNLKNIGIVLFVILLLLQFLVTWKNIVDEDSEEEALSFPRIKRYADGLPLMIWFFVGVGIVAVYCGHTVLGCFYLLALGLNFIWAQVKLQHTQKTLAMIIEQADQEKLVSTQG